MLSTAFAQATIALAFLATVVGAWTVYRAQWVSKDAKTIVRLLERVQSEQEFDRARLQDLSNHFKAARARDGKRGQDERPTEPLALREYLRRKAGLQ